MALGGGVFLTQNKVLPGTYINFVSASNASATLSDRGITAMALELDWGAEGSVFKVESSGFKNNSLKIFGYDYTSEKLKGLRDLFKNIKTGFFYRLNSGVKATCTYATAKYSGIRGNDLKIVITANVDDNAKYDVSTFLGTTKLDTQTVSTMAGLVSNDYVDFITTATIALTAGTALTGGTNGEAVTGTQYQAFLDKLESYSFNTLGCLSTTAEIISLFVQYTKRMRDTNGIKFQTVVYKTAADYEGVISVENTVLDSGANTASLVYWVTGIAAGCAVNKSNTNKLYDGEFTADVDYKQSDLEAGIEAGKFMFHKVGDAVRVLEDLNTFISITDEKGSDFCNNQTIRVLDQIANDIAVLFNTKYLGNVANNAAGRISFWNEVVSYDKELEKLQAIEGFSSEDVAITAGTDKKSIVVSNAITIINAMTKLYMTVVIS